ncbi:hypothetical protein OG897_38590 [Streptomyces sp. NBC_00237]|uniref:hypothetical protein n=1 Tax=Streptomyces sp. NBC_00237 TaxID=2975687 RepID=UPI00224C961F|nr:hypothetical protein [Streptomyces sp. NBC_00237]MCX5207301.1 hypothetical protein [Streptomyces sp. NBC_00237]
MSEHDDDRVQEAGEVGEVGPEAVLREQHSARAASAAARATALFHYVEQHAPSQARDVGMTSEQILWKASNAARVSAQALAVLAESAPDPAADSRCARNAAASAAQAAQAGQLCDGDSQGSADACRAAIKASQSAGAAATAAAGGADEVLNAEADADEAAAVAAAVAAGWVKPGQALPEVSTGVRSADLMSMMHL